MPFLQIILLLVKLMLGQRFMPLAFVMYGGVQWTGGTGRQAKERGGSFVVMLDKTGSRRLTLLSEGGTMDGGHMKLMSVSVKASVTNCLVSALAQCIVLHQHLACE